MIISRKQDAFKNHCFQILGYPDWYEGPQDNKSSKIVAKSVSHSADYIQDRPLDEGNREHSHKLHMIMVLS